VEFPRALFRRGDEVLLEFAVGVGVGGQGEALAGVDDLEARKVMPPRNCSAGLVEGERLTNGADWIGSRNRFRREVVAEVGSEQGAVDAALLEIVVDGDGLDFGGSGWDGEDCRSGEAGRWQRQRRLHPGW